MSNSLRDQLLGLGHQQAPPERKPDPVRKSEGGKAGPRAVDPRKKPDSRPPSARTQQQHGPKPRTREEMDLAKAYALRNDQEKRERIAAEQLKQEEARLRREAKAKLAELIKGQTLNDPAAELVRHFPYGGKIKRVHVSAEQLRALNAGELGVLQEGGRYLVVTAALLAEAEAIFPAAVALKVDPDAPAQDDPYADPRYQVPDDLTW